MLIIDKEVKCKRVTGPAANFENNKNQRPQVPYFFQIFAII